MRKTGKASRRLRVDFAAMIAEKRRSLIMGILNVTPDSFSDGGKFYAIRQAKARALTMVRDGADIIDIGGESARPGAREVSVEEEIARVVPVIKALARATRIPISIDTRKAAVAEAALAAGASIVNDVSGLRHDPALADVVAKCGAALVIMHSRGTPSDMQSKARYRNVVSDVISELRAPVSLARRAGIGKRSIAVDPGIGFAKTASQSIELIHELRRFKRAGYPLCVGLSRKSFIGKVTGQPEPALRLAGTIAANIIAVMNGADILRVHDVKEALDAAAVAAAILKS